MKLKKLLATVLALAMVLTVIVAIPVFADGEEYVAELYSYNRSTETTDKLTGQYTSIQELSKHVGISDEVQILQRIKLLKSTSEDILVEQDNSACSAGQYIAVECAEGVSWTGKLLTKSFGYHYSLLGNTGMVGKNTYILEAGSQGTGKKDDPTIIASNDMASAIGNYNGPYYKLVTDVTTHGLNATPPSGSTIDFAGHTWNTSYEIPFNDNTTFMDSVGGGGFNCIYNGNIFNGGQNNWLYVDGGIYRSTGYIINGTGNNTLKNGTFYGNMLINNNNNCALRC